MDIQTKLSKFYKMVMAEAENKNLSEFVHDYDKIQTEIKNYFDSLYADMIEKINIQKLKFDSQTDKFLASKIFDIRKNLLLKRLDLKDIFFAELKKKVTDFVKTDDYEKYILDKLNNFDPKKYKFENFVFEFSYKDESLISRIKNNFEFEFLFSKADFIGGYKIYANNHKILIDKTFDNKIRKLENQFNKFKLVEL